MASVTREELIKKLQAIKNQGFVKTHRPHDTGIGKTLEDLLGIKENNFRLPDFGDVELKAKRLESGSMLTLATKSPHPKSVNKVLFEKYKYPDAHGVYSLHSTVCGSRVNPQGFRIVVEDDKLILHNKQKIEAFWPIATFDDVLRFKVNSVLLVLADTKGERKTEKEHFHYKEAFLLSNLDRTKFNLAIKEDWLKVDIRIGCYRSGIQKGKYHDHGTAFRINRTDYIHLFRDMEQPI